MKSHKMDIKKFQEFEKALLEEPDVLKTLTMLSDKWEDIATLVVDLLVENDHLRQKQYNTVGPKQVRIQKKR